MHVGSFCGYPLPCVSADGFASAGGNYACVMSLGLTTRTRRSVEQRFPTRFLRRYPRQFVATISATIQKGRPVHTPWQSEACPLLAVPVLGDHRRLGLVWCGVHTRVIILVCVYLSSQYFVCAYCRCVLCVMCALCCMRVSTIVQCQLLCSCPLVCKWHSWFMCTD